VRGGQDFLGTKTRAGGEKFSLTLKTQNESKLMTKN